MKKEEAIESVESGLLALANALKEGRSDELATYLEFAARFHRYSFGNVLLILSQRPDASRVAGYRKWEDFGRNVKKGEKGIAILAPMKRRRKKEPEDENEDAKQANVILGFKVVFVFDLAQTEGDELPEFTAIQGDPGNHAERLESAIRDQGIEIEEDILPLGTLGLSSGGTITVRAGLEPNVRLSVLVHEFAHELLKHKKRRGELSKTVRECEAESIAAVVLSALGLDSSKRSSDYIQLYRGDTKTLGESLDAIQRTAVQILDAMENVSVAPTASESAACQHSLHLDDESSTWIAFAVEGGTRFECSVCGRFYGVHPGDEPIREVVTDSIEADAPRIGRADYQQRREGRIERLEERAVRARRESDARYQQAKEMAGHIPFGQPILVGHHSEQRDRRYRKRIHDNFGKAFELGDKAKQLSSRAVAAEQNDAISSDDPEALIKLREKLQDGEDSQQQMKAINAAWRAAGKPTPSDDEGWNRVSSRLPNTSPESLGNLRKEMAQPWHIYDAPFPPYALSNNNANNRRVRQRIAQLDKEGTNREARERDSGFCIRRENVGNNRIQLVFPGKPEKAVRDLLKQNGFRWARSEMAWQRLLNDAGRRAADLVIGQLKHQTEVAS